VSVEYLHPAHLQSHLHIHTASQSSSSLIEMFSVHCAPFTRFTSAASSPLQEPGTKKQLRVKASNKTFSSPASPHSISTSLVSPAASHSQNSSKQLTLPPLTSSPTGESFVIPATPGSFYRFVDIRTPPSKPDFSSPLSQKTVNSTLTTTAELETSPAPSMHDTSVSSTQSALSSLVYAEQTDLLSLTDPSIFIECDWEVRSPFRLSSTTSLFALDSSTSPVSFSGGENLLPGLTPPYLCVHNASAALLVLSVLAFCSEKFQMEFLEKILHISRFCNFLLNIISIIAFLSIRRSIQSASKLSLLGFHRVLLLVFGNILMGPDYKQPSFEETSVLFDSFADAMLAAPRQCSNGTVFVISLAHIYLYELLLQYF
jgi:hypothetical protein